jgi:hypothetical protein
MPLVIRTKVASSGREQIVANSVMVQAETPDAKAKPSLLGAFGQASGRGDKDDTGVSEDTPDQQNAVEPEEMYRGEDAASVQAYQGQKRKRGKATETKSGASSGKKQRVAKGRNIRTIAPRRNPTRAARPVQKPL